MGKLEYNAANIEMGITGDEAEETARRLAAVLESPYVAALGPAEDFEGSTRVLFSLDHPRFSMVEVELLPKIINLLEGVMRRKLDLRFCRGGYGHLDGEFVQEVSFLVKVDEPVDSFLERLVDYLHHYTKQESYIEITKNNLASMPYLSGMTATQNLGIWREVSKETALQSVSYTQLGNYWFTAKPVGKTAGVEIVSDCHPELLGHPFLERLDKLLPFCKMTIQSEQIVWRLEQGGLDLKVELFIDPHDKKIFLCIEHCFGTLDEDAPEAYEFICRYFRIIPWPVRVAVSNDRRCFVQYANEARLIEPNSIHDILDQCHHTASLAWQKLVTHEVKGFHGIAVGTQKKAA